MKKLSIWLASSVAAALAVCPVPAFSQSFTPIRVNTGGTSSFDSEGNSWSADYAYNTGNVATYGGNVAGTSDSWLYQTLRWDTSSAPELQYSFSIPNGTYRVKLLFAETWSGAFQVGVRKFDVRMEGATIFDDLDVFAQAGAAAALVKLANVTVADGQLNIEFIHVSDNPFVSAIEITNGSNPSQPTGLSGIPHFSTTQIDLSWNASVDDGSVAYYELERCQGSGCSTFALIAGPTGTEYRDSGLSPGTAYRYRVRAVDNADNRSDYSGTKTFTTLNGTLPAPTRINVGGGSYTDSSSNLWGSDAGFNTGTAAYVGATISGTTDQTLYRYLRWDNATAPELEYNFSVPSGQYDINLHFAETWYGAFSVGARVFGVKVNGTTIIPALDIYSEVGANAALVKYASTLNTDGSLSISFVHGVDNPFINAIEILPDTPPDSEAPTAPTGLGATPISLAQVNLTWIAATDNVVVSGYRIERCTGTSCENFSEIGTSATTGYADSTLMPETTYRYRVRAFDGIGNRGPYSAIASATTTTGQADTTYYSYDALGRLHHVTHPDGTTVSYFYDASGNITSKVQVGQ